MLEISMEVFLPIQLSLLFGGISVSDVHNLITSTLSTSILYLKKTVVPRYTTNLFISQNTFPHIINQHMHAQEKNGWPFKQTGRQAGYNYPKQKKNSMCHYAFYVNWAFGVFTLYKCPPT
jgi:hypothetical protein